MYGKEICVDWGYFGDFQKFIIPSLSRAWPIHRTRARYIAAQPFVSGRCFVSGPLNFFLYHFWQVHVTRFAKIASNRKSIQIIASIFMLVYGFEVYKF